ncbi:MAG TPA: TIGR03087 family PEP-CTERM/XrtA system glycosyltransferase [bacterium]|nr:TIGR03087 family PEP-CTERM/XrtA system glycosyltransferase [bacterium]
MNILFLTQRVPEPPNKGDKIRSHHLAKRLARHHAVHLAFLLDGTEEEEHARATKSWAASARWRLRSPMESAARSVWSAVRGRPMTCGYFHSGALADDIGGLLAREKFDVAVAYCSSMADYLHGFSGPKVLDLVDVDSEKWKQYADRAGFGKSAVYECEHRLLRRYERRLVDEFDRVIVISRAEREQLSRFAEVSNVAVVSSGVDAQAWRRPDSRGTARDLVFVGTLDYFANTDGITHFVHEIFPSIRSRRAGTRLKIVGRKPGPEVRALDEVEGVEVIPDVDDVRPYVWGSEVFVAPLRIAQGQQNKVLEAMAAGVPVVATPAALRGIEGTAGEHYCSAATPQEFVNEVVGLLEDRERAAEMGERAGALVRARYTWEGAAQEFENELQYAIQNASAKKNGAGNPNRAVKSGSAP